MLLSILSHAHVRAQLKYFAGAFLSEIKKTDDATTGSKRVAKLSMSCSFAV